MVTARKEHTSQNPASMPSVPVIVCYTGRQLPNANPSKHDILIRPRRNTDEHSLNMYCTFTLYIIHRHLLLIAFTFHEKEGFQYFSKRQTVISTYCQQPPLRAFFHITTSTQHTFNMNPRSPLVVEIEDVAKRPETDIIHI